ncbi:MAG: hydantoinase/oxoprolinase N-terminal domain-containing protein, partial [Planctomycetota bacterium]
MTWQFWIDVGGTFTDCIGRSTDGRLIRHKLLSSGVTKGSVGQGSDRTRIADPARHADPEAFWTGYRLRLLDSSGSAVAESTVAGFDSSDHSDAVLRLADPLSVDPTEGQPYELASGEEAPIVGIRHMLGLPLAAELPPMVVRLGTTRGTNALVTRRGAQTAFITTRGFGDILRIGYQNRPKLFELGIRKPEPLFSAVVEIDERITPEGEVLVAPEALAIRHQLADLKRLGIDSLAVCLMHAYAHPEHERLVERIARAVGFQEISLSGRVAPLVKIVSRGDTTV